MIDVVVAMGHCGWLHLLIRKLGYLASNTWLNDVERQCCGCRNQSAKWSPIDFTTGFSGQWAEKEKKVWRLHGCSMPNMSEKANGQMVTIGWGWGQNSDQIRESLNRCLSLSRTYSQTESKKILQTVQRRTQFSIHMCVLVSNSYHSLYFLLWWYIYIYTHYLLLALYICTGACRNRNHLPLLRPARYRIHQFYKLRSNKVP